MKPFVKINEKNYEVDDISLPAEHLLKIVFTKSKPLRYGSTIESYTKGGILATSFEGYGTVYQSIDDRTDILSDDGSVYEPPQAVEPSEPYEPTLDEVRTSKRAEISAVCQATIHAGVDVKLADGTKHFSLSTEDQLNLFGKQAQLAAGAKQCEYHADGEPCRYYNATDMQAVITAAMQYVSYHTTYCNSFFSWINAEDDKDTIKEMAYGDQIPDDYKSEVLQAYEAAM